MQKSATIQLLKTFSENELMDFDKFIQSPFFNSRNSVTKFYFLVKKGAPCYEGDDIKKEIIFMKLYPGKPYNDEVIRRLLADLKKIIDQYLAYTQFKSDKYLTARALLTEYKNRRQAKLFEQKLERTNLELNKTDNYDKTYFEAKREIHNLMLGYIFHMNKLNIKNYDFSKRGEYMIYSFLIDALNLKFDTLFVSREMNRDEEISLPDIFFNHFDMGAITDYLKKTNSPYYDTFALIYAGLQAFTNNNDDDFYFEYKSLIHRQWNTFTKGAKYILYINLSTFCSFKIEDGKIDFRKELFSLYERMLNENFYIFAENGYFDINLWRQILLTAVLLKKYEWSSDFIQRHKGSLSPETRSDTVNLSCSRLAFAQGDYERALEYISNINSDYSIFKTDVRNLMLQIYYEMNYTEQLLSLMDSYKHFLSSNQHISGFKKNKYSGFINNIGSLLKLKRKADTVRIKAFIETVMATQASFGDWLILKANEIKAAKT